MECEICGTWISEWIDGECLDESWACMCSNCEELIGTGVGVRYCAENNYVRAI